MLMPLGAFRDILKDSDGRGGQVNVASVGTHWPQILAAPHSLLEHPPA